MTSTPRPASWGRDHRDPGIGEAGKTSAYVPHRRREVRREPNDVIAVSTRCAHLGCPVRFRQAAQNFICSLRWRLYDFEGKRIGGPPVRPLDRFPTRVRAVVELGPRYR